MDYIERQMSLLELLYAQSTNNSDIPLSTERIKVKGKCSECQSANVVRSGKMHEGLLEQLINMKWKCLLFYTNVPSLAFVILYIMYGSGKVFKIAI